MITHHQGESKKARRELPKAEAPIKPRRPASWPGDLGERVQCATCREWEFKLYATAIDGEFYCRDCRDYLLETMVKIAMKAGPKMPGILPLEITAEDVRGAACGNGFFSPIANAARRFAAAAGWPETFTFATGNYLWFGVWFYQPKREIARRQTLFDRTGEWAPGPIAFELAEIAFCPVCGRWADPKSDFVIGTYCGEWVHIDACARQHHDNCGQCQAIEDHLEDRAIANAFGPDRAMINAAFL